MKELPQELEARIAAYIDGELPAAEAARLEVFLANTDPQLAQQVIGMLADKHAARSLPRVAAPADLSARIMEQVERSTLLNDVHTFAAPQRPAWASRLAVAAALLLVLTGFSYFIFQSVHRGDETQWHAVVSAEGHHPAAPASAAAPATSEAVAAPVPASEPQMLASANGPTPAAAVRRREKDSTTEAAAQIAADAPVAGDQTVQLTLLATDAGDAARLRTTLEGFLSQDPDVAARQAELPNATFGRNQASQEKAEEPFIVNEPARQRGSSLQQQQYTESQASQAPQAAQLFKSQQQQAVPSPAMPYHILLRPAQLQELTHQFQVQTLSRGQLAAANANASNTGASNSGAGSNAGNAAVDWLECTISLTPAPPPPPSLPLNSAAVRPSATPSAATSPR